MKNEKSKLAKIRGDETQGQLAKAIGVSTSTIGMYETGKRVPRDDIKVKIAKHYNMTVQEIFFT